MESLSLSDVFAQLRTACRQAGSQEAFAAHAGISRGHLSDVLNARRDPGPKLLAALGLRKVAAFMEIGKS